MCNRSIQEGTELSSTGRPVMASGQELNVGNAQIRTLLDRQRANPPKNHQSRKVAVITGAKRTGHCSMRTRHLLASATT